MMYYEVYNTPLGEVRFGALFLMLNYSGAFMRVCAGDDLLVVRPMRAGGDDPVPFNDDGVHVPILEVATGRVSWMAKEKPCRVM